MEFQDILVTKNETEINMMSPLTWAYVGDSVYEMYVRTYLSNITYLNPHRMHVLSIKYVKAEAQARIVKELDLSDDEQEIVRREKAEATAVTCQHIDNQVSAVTDKIRTKNN